MGGHVMRAAGVSVLVLLVAGCAAPTTQRVAVTNQQTADEVRKQMEIVAEELVSEQRRLERVHFELATNAIVFCPKTTSLTGLHLAVEGKGEVAKAMARLYSLGKTPTVLFTVPGSPAEKAGLKEKDKVLDMLGLPTTDLKPIQEKLRTLKPGEPIEITAQRDGQPVSFRLEPVHGCDYPAVLSPEQALNAFADGEKIHVMRGMMAFAKTDEELALVIAHEMAHNTMKHIDAKRINAMGGLVADVALAVLTRGAYRQSSISNAAGQAFSQEFEAEADYVGLYMMANTKYAIDEAPKFWRRMAAANPGSIKGTHNASHPATSYRMVALEATVQEIEGKRAKSQALLPDRKDGKAFVAGEALLPGSAGYSMQPAECLQGQQDSCKPR